MIGCSSSSHRANGHNASGGQKQHRKSGGTFRGANIIYASYCVQTTSTAKTKERPRPLGFRAVNATPLIPDSLSGPREG
jgi:hypothetical protein